MLSVTLGLSFQPSRPSLPERLASQATGLQDEGFLLAYELTPATQTHPRLLLSGLAHPPSHGILSADLIQPTVLFPL